MAVKIKRKTSRLRHATLFNSQGIEFWSRTSVPVVPASPSDKIHLVENSDRIDALAKRYYGDESLDWVIAHANGFMDLPGDLRVGQKIRIPDPFLVRKYQL
jgi:nucleoid-associated protein YgaU